MATRKPEKVSEQVGGLLVTDNIQDRELRAIKNAWDKSIGGGRDEGAREMAKAYVEAHPEKFADMEDMTLEQIINAVETFRNAGMETMQWLAETWLLAKVPRQEIGGTISFPVDVPIKEL